MEAARLKARLKAGAEHPGKGTFSPGVLETAQGIDPFLPSPPAPQQLLPTTGGKRGGRQTAFPVGTPRAKLRIKSQPEQADLRTGATAQLLFVRK